MSRRVFWIVFLSVLALTLGLKSSQRGWFAPRPKLELDGKPVLLFFNKTRGCECEIFVYDNANAQVDLWNAPLRIIHIDMDRRPDLARQYSVIRAPALVLLDGEDQAVWKQDETASDEAPLDLNQAERQIEALVQTP